MKSWRSPRLSQVTISVTIATIIDDMVAARMKRALLSIVCPGAVRSLVSRFRSSHTLALTSDANFEIKGTLASIGSLCGFVSEFPSADSRRGWREFLTHHTSDFARNGGA